LGLEVDHRTEETTTLAPKTRLLLAFVAYAVIGALAAVSLSGKLRIAVWLLLGFFAVKTWIASVSERTR